MPDNHVLTDRCCQRHLSAVRCGCTRSPASSSSRSRSAAPTRLTESGLSITEWKPVTGVLPPFVEADWQAEFQKYQAIPQYREVQPRHEPRCLQDDLLLGVVAPACWRAPTGFVFLVPFLFFLWRGWIRTGLKARLWTIFAGGAALGAVGWWMVSSAGRQQSRQRVAIPARLSSDVGLRDLRRGAVDRAKSEARWLARDDAGRGAGAVARGSVGAARCWCCCRSISARWWRASMPDWSITPGP